MKKFFNKYLPFAKASFLNLLAYKFPVLCWLVVDIISIVVMFFVWNAVYQSYASTQGIPLDQVVLNGFSLKEMISYVIIVFIFTVTVSNSDTSDSIDNEVKNGTIAVQLMKPISYRVRFIFSALGTLFAVNILFGLPLLVVCYTLLYVFKYITFISVGDIFIKIALFIASEILACLITDVFNYIFGIMSFYTIGTFGLVNIKIALQRFLSGTLIPITFLMNSEWGWCRWLGTIINYSPFVFMAQNPTFILMGKLSYIEIGQSFLLGIIWLIAFEIIAKLFYNFAIKRLVVQGG